VQIMHIESMSAHDAVGLAVPSHLEVAGGNIVTLTVEHRKAPYTYPIMAGPSFEVGYSTVSAYIPPSREQWEAEKKQKEEEENHGGWAGDESAEEQAASRAAEGVVMLIGVGAPESSEPNPQGGATGSKLPSYSKNVKVRACSSFELLGVGGCELWYRDQKMHFHFNGATAWWNPNEVHPNCTEAFSETTVTQSLEYCNWTGPNYQPYGGGYHISAQMVVAITMTVPVTGIAKQSINPITTYIYGDGFVSPHRTGAICNPNTPEEC
jgi:hypothetical protein